MHICTLVCTKYAAGTSPCVCVCACGANPADLTCKIFDMEICWFRPKPADLWGNQRIQRISHAKKLTLRSAGFLVGPKDLLVSAETGGSHMQNF